jgi:predicted nucleotidyltransferase
MKGVRLNSAEWKPLKRERPELLKPLELFGTTAGFRELDAGGAAVMHRKWSPKGIRGFFMPAFLPIECSIGSKMHPLIENNREAIGVLCRRHGVRRLELFGSILREDFDAARSDVDILVEFDPAVAGSFANYLELKESLQGLFGRPVDLVELGAVRNRRLRRYIEQSKSPLYDAA